MKSLRIRPPTSRTYGILAVVSAAILILGAGVALGMLRKRGFEDEGRQRLGSIDSAGNKGVCSHIDGCADAGHGWTGGHPGDPLLNGRLP